MSRSRITPRARDDLKNIGRYTQQQWGKTQRNAYLKDLEQRFRWIAENPQPGTHRSEVTEGYHSFPQGEHVIFYLIGHDGIIVIGIAHKAMDSLSYFLNN